MRPMTRTGVSLDEAVVARLHVRAGPARWGVSRDRLAAALARSCAHRFGADATNLSPTALVAYLETLHVADLALACACRDGTPEAWDDFLRDVQPKVRAAALSLAGPAGHELADDLVADLYGTTERDGVRRSLFDYFHGRSRLTTWLRTVLAQRHVDSLRARRRSVSLEEIAAPAGREGPSPDAHLADPSVDRDAEGQVAARADRGRLLSTFERELSRAVAALTAEDRLRLSYYYLHRRTLAQIGRLMGEHESSASRKLERVRQQLRIDLERTLREGHGFGAADLRQCYDDVSRHGTVDLGTLLESRESDANG